MFHFTVTTVEQQGLEAMITENAHFLYSLKIEKNGTFTNQRYKLAGIFWETSDAKFETFSISCC